MKEAIEILKQLKQGNYQPVYFLQGEESYYIDLISDYIQDQILQEADKGFNQVITYGKDHDMSSIISQAKRFPMMSERQVVVVKEAQEIKDINKESGQKALINYLDHPLSSTVLVFSHKNKLLDGRKSLGKALAKKAILLNSKKLYDNQIPTWINDYVKEKGFKIGVKASRLIAESIGTTLSRLSNELDKLFINLKPNEEINELHVEQNIGVSKDYNVFELNNALMAKDILKANQIIHYFSKNPKSAPFPMLVGSLYGLFSKLLMLYQLPNKSKESIAQTLKVHPFFANDYKMALQKYSMIQVVNIISFLRDADGQSKGLDGGSVNEENLSKELLFKILHV